jgi:hypothetical protein
MAGMVGKRYYCGVCVGSDHRGSLAGPLTAGAFGYVKTVYVS